MSRRITDDERQTIIDAIRAGTPRNQIARNTGRSPGTITNIARAAGITDAFDRSATKRACEASRADNASRRAALVSGLLDDAERLRSQLFAPTTVFNFGGRDNTYEERVIREPTFADKRHIMAAVRLAATTARDLELVDQDEGGFSAVDQWLRGMIGDVTGELAA